MNEKEAIDIVDNKIWDLMNTVCGNCIIEDHERDDYQEAIETVLNLLEKKDKIINSIKEYAQQEIDFATEDIEDYIDDDREGNKDIIGELKEWREHWKDIIRIMNNEKTYMDF